MSSYFGNPTFVLWALSLCQKYMLTLRISSKGMLLTLAILETSKGRTSARDRDIVSLVVLTRQRMFLSWTIRSLTSLALVTSVVATATRLRNVAPLSTWWNCTWIPWDEDAPIKDVPIKVDNLKHTSTPNLMSTWNKLSDLTSLCKMPLGAHTPLLWEQATPRHYHHLMGTLRMRRIWSWSLPLATSLETLTRLLHFEIPCYLMLLLWMMFDCGCCNRLVVVRTW